MKEEDNNISSPQIPKAIDEEFINTYRKLPELWDTANKHYTNKYKRNAAHDVLLKIMKGWNPTATRFHVRQRINILRSSYKKDLKRYLASKSIGPDGEATYEYKPRNWKFHAMKFLDKDISDKNNILEVNIDDNDEDAATNDSTSENDEPTSHSDVLASFTDNESYKQTYKKKRKNKRLKVDLNNQCYIENYASMVDRELEAIGANVTCKLKRMDPMQRYHAELLINRVLISGLKNNLTDDTDLTEVYKAS